MSQKENHGINARSEIDNAAQQRINEEKNSPSILSKQRVSSPPGTKSFLFTIIIIATTISGILIYKAIHIKDNTKEETDNEQTAVHRVIPQYTPTPQEEYITTDNINNYSQSKQEDELIRQRMLSSPLSNSNNDQIITTDTKTLQSNSFLSHENTLSNNLQSLHFSTAIANKLLNRDLLISQGNMIECVLETRLVTTQPGMTSCHLTRDIYSASGRVILLDRGSKVTGYYQSGITQGQARIFITWNRVETPEGVIIDLASPGTSPLGEAGIGGYVDNHFWQRFGGAIMISLIGDLGDWISHKNENQNNTIQFNNITNGTEQAAIEALHNTINIPPTLYKNHGERISIFIARDLDFSNVYKLKAND